MSIKTQNFRAAADDIRGLKAAAPSPELNRLAGSLADTLRSVASLADSANPDGPAALTEMRAACGVAPTNSLRAAQIRPLDAVAKGLHRDCLAVMADPQKRATLIAVVKVLCRAPISQITDKERGLVRALTTGDSSLGQALSLNEPLGEDIYVLLSRYAAFRTLGLIPMDSGVKKFATVSGRPTASWYQASAQGTTISATAYISGASISPEVATLGTNVEVSGEVVGDGETTFAAALLAALIEGLGYGIDYASFRGDGTADTTNGGMTGIFLNGDVPSVNAANGNTTVAALTHDDFANLIGGVAASALSHPCRFWIAVEFFTKLLKIKDGSDRLLKPPTIPEDDWRILGFPVTFVGVGAAPSTDTAGQKVVAFGRESAYTVGLRRNFEVASSPHAGWAKNAYLFRAIARARCLMRDATSLATLKLAAN